MEINEDLETEIKIGKNINDKAIRLTKEGYLKRKKRLQILITEIRPKILEELSEARKQGDLSENADYDYAKNKQSQIEEEIIELENLLTKAQIFEETNSQVVTFGSKVEYQDLSTDKIKKIKIVDPAEVDPNNDPPLVSFKSPISTALMDSKPGDIKKVETNKKKYMVKILNII